MRTLILALLAAAAPAAALAQLSPAEQRMLDVQRRLDQYEQNQRVDALERQVENLEARVRTNENIRVLEEQRAQIPRDTPPLVSPAPPATPADLAEAERRRQASLTASEQRLKMLSDQMAR